MGKEIVIIPQNNQRTQIHKEMDSIHTYLSLFLLQSSDSRMMTFSNTLFTSQSFYTYWLVKGRATLQKRNSRVQINQSVAQSLDSKPQKDYHPTHWRANAHNNHNHKNLRDSNSAALSAQWNRYP